MRRLLPLSTLLLLAATSAFGQNPTLTSATPNFAVIGSTVTVTLTSSDSSFPTSSVIVAIDGNQEFTNVTTTSSQYVGTLSSSLLSAAGASTSHVITISGASTTSNSLQFIIYATPNVSNVTPAEVGVGSSDLTIAITGNNFVSGVTTMTWCNLCGGSPTSLSTTFVSSTQLTTVVPLALLNAVGQGNLAVSEGNYATNVKTIDIRTPQLNSISPNSTPAAADMTITVNGLDFVSSSRVRICSGGGCSVVPLTPLATSVVSTTQLTATIPAASLSAAYAAGQNIQVSADNGSTANGYYTNNNNLNVTPPIPSVSSISPTNTPALGPSFIVTVNGANFVSGVSTVTFAGTPLVTTFITASQITATVPSTLIASNGTATVAVQNGNGAPSSTNATFTITVPTPAVTLVNPSSAVSGSGNTSITVSGSNFLNGVSTATWCSTNTSPCSGTLTTLATTYSSSTSLTAIVPTAQLTTANTFYVGVTNTNGGSAPSPYPFVVTSPTTPTVSSVSPPSYTAGTPNTVTITLTGTNFVSGASGSVATWCNACSGSPVSLGTTVNSANSLTAVVPPNLLAAQGSAQIGVSNNNGSVVSTVNQTFTINPKPTISGINPASAIATQGTISTVTISGANFPTTATVVNWVGPTGNAQLTIASNTASSIVVSIPNTLLTTAGSATITVTDTVTNVTATSAFSINPKPVLNSLSQTSATVGQTQFNLTVTGTNFNNVSPQVYWTVGGTATQLSAVTYGAPTSLTVTVPANLLTSPVTANITVTDSVTQVSSNALTLSVTASGITSVSPNSAVAGSQSGVPITVTGSGFVNGASQITWNGSTTSLTTIFGSATQLQTTIPASFLATSGTALVGVSTGGTASPGSQTFTITGAPVLSLLNSTSASAGQSPFNIILTGTNFPTGSPVVNFTLGQTTSLVISSKSSTSITATVSSAVLDTPGVATISVSDSVSGVTSNSLSFTINAPAVSSLSPTGATAGTTTAVPIQVNGSNFVTGSIVTWCNACGSAFTMLTTTYGSGVQINATIPANLLTATGTAQIGVINTSTGQPSTTQPFTIGSGPSLTSLSPLSAVATQPGAVSLTLTGSNFPTSNVQVSWKFAGVTTVLPINNGTSTTTSITVTVAPSLLSTAGAATVTIMNTAIGVSSGSQTFTINPAPVVTVLNPQFAFINPSIDLPLSITGTNLPTSPIVTWTFSGRSTNLAVTAGNSSTSITATILKNLLTTVGTATVVVTDSSTLASSAPQSFSVSSNPQISSLLPGSASVGAGTFSLTLTGSAFLSSDVLLWTPAGGTADTITGPTVGNGGNSISFNIPARDLTVPGTVTLQIQDTVNGVFSTLVSLFTVNAPALTSLSQTTIPVGSGATNITVNGTDFVNSTKVTWCGGSTSCSAPLQLTTTFSSSTQLTALVPANLLATPGSFQVGAVTVQVSSNVTATSSQTFTVGGASISSINPASVQAGSGQTTVTVNGSNFVSGAIVTFCSATCTSATQLATTFVTANQLTAIIPVSSLVNPGAFQIGVLTGTLAAGYSPSGAGDFTIGAPTVNTISPTSATAGASTGTTIVITGTSFGPSSVATYCNTTSGCSSTTDLSTTFNTSNQLTAVLPTTITASAATLQIGVRTGSVAAGTSSGQPVTFAIIAPSLNSVSPTGTTAGITGATTITVNGSNFLSTSLVTWCSSCNGSPTTLITTFVGGSQLTATVPATLVALQGSAFIGVLNGSQASTNTLTFTVGGVGLSAVTPTAATSGSPGLSIAITGSNFTTGAQVVFTVGSTPTVITPTSITSSLIQAVIPSAALTTPGVATISVQIGSSVSNSSPFTISGPTITGVTPTKSATGVGSFPITVAGSNFLTGSTVQWTFGGTTTALSTSYQDASTLVAIVNAAQVASAGTALVSVLNAGGAASSGSIFTVGAAPSINTDSTGLNPFTVSAGAAATALVIQGTNYQSSSIVTWNNAGAITNLATGFVSSTQLTATVPASLLANAGSALVAVQNPGTVNSNSVTFTIAPGVTPSVTPPLVPSSASAGGAQFQLAVMGSNFVSGSVIQWNSGATTTALNTSLASSQLTALVPASLIATPGTVFISVLNPGGGASSAVPFTISANQPSISTTGGLTPATTQVGSPGFQLAITGTGFATGATVQWNAGSSAQAVPAVFVSSTSLTAIVPTSLLTTAGTVLITVTNPGGALSNSSIFSITPASAPTISSTGPSTAVVAGPSFQMTVTGTNFFAGSIVQWSTGATPTALTTSYISPTQLSAVVPASLLTAAGSAFVTVLNPGGIASNAASFTVGTAPGPMLTTLSPASTVAGGASFQLLIGGANFATGSVVQWNGGTGVTALSTVVLSATQLSALVPATLIATPGTAFIDVMNTGGAISNATPYNIVAGASPTINSTGGLTPATATVGATSIQLTVVGANFIPTSTVQWSTGATPTVLSTVYVSATQLSALIPASLLSTAGTAFVSVSNGTGNSSNSVPFTVGVQGAPTISTANGLLPASAAAGSLTMQLVVVGTNFVSGSTVYWNTGTNLALTTSYVGPSQLTAVLPATLLATAGVAFVSVQNPGPVNSNSVQFTIGTSTSLPTISSSGGLQPAAANAGSAAFQMVVTGANFLNGSIVQWNANGTAVPLTTGFGNSTTLNALVPATLITTPGIAFISVTNPDKTTSNSITFTVAGSNPVVSALVPTSAAAGTPGLQLTITGTGFSSSSVVQWNGTAVPTNFGSATQVTATIAATLLASPGTNFVTVVNPGGTITAGSTFTVAGPTLTTLAPSTAVSGGAIPLTLTLTGTNFVTGSIASWNGTALPTSISSATTGTAQVSVTQLSTAGTFVVIVTNPGNAATGSQFFTLTAPNAPALTGVTPASAVAGAGAFQLTVAGTGFVAGSAVQWNGTALATTFVSATQITALIDSSLIASAGTANITVQIPGALISATTKFPINGASITTLAPANISAGGPAFVITVTGGNFIPGSTVQWNGTGLPTVYNSATQLTADVAASYIVSGGTASVTVLNGGTAVSAPSTFTIGPFTLAISTTTLPDSVVGTGYSQILNATGGSPPYAWSITAGTLPTGITLDPGTGTLAGTATAAVAGTIGFTVTDSVARTITRSIAFRSVSPITISTATPLTSAPSGTPFSQILAATGGTAPYTWSLTGSLPTGFALNTTSGQISGTPTVPGSYNFTINIADSRSQSASVPFAQTVTATGVTITGVTATATSGQQLPVSVTIATPYAVNLTGSLTVVFTSAVGATDPAIQFSSGGLIANFTIPAGTTQAVFGTQQSVLLLTGTTSGTLAVSASLQAAGASVTPTSAPAITATIAKAPPVISSVTLTTSGTTLVVSVTGFSNTRDMTTGNFQFIAAPGSTLTAAPIAVNLATTFSSWYQSSASLNFGSQFTFAVPITFTGNVSAIGSVSVTLVNSAGTSAAATATRQ